MVAGNINPSRLESAIRGLKESAVTLSLNTFGYSASGVFSPESILALSQLVSSRLKSPLDIRVDEKLGPIDPLPPGYELPYPSIDVIKTSYLCRQDEIRDSIEKDARRSVLMSPRNSFVIPEPDFLHEF